MTGTWQGPSIELKVALSKGPNDTVSSGDFTDLSDRVLSIELDRGRSDPLRPFEPGTLTVELDNTDRALDPSNPSGLVYAADGDGLPLCPVTLDLVFDATTTRRFTGFLGPECWPSAGPSPWGPIATVTLMAQDALAWSKALPTAPWHCMIQATFPDFWLDMDHGFPVLVNGSQVRNRAASGGYGTIVESDSSLTRVNRYFGGLPEPQLKFSENHKLKIAAADAFPDGDEANVTMCMWWGNDQQHTTGQESTVLALTSPGGSTKRFDLIIDDAGDAIATWYDSGGSSLDSVTISKPAGRWDDQTGAFVVVRWTSGNNCEVWVGGYSDTTTAAASTVYESDIYIGPSDIDPWVDEFVLWRGSNRPTSDEVDGIILAATEQVYPWQGDNWYGDGVGLGSRPDHWFRAAGREPDASDVDEWHLPVDDGESGFWGVGRNGGTPPNFGEALRTVAGPNGGVWITKDGLWRVRTAEALEDSTYAADYATSCADFTDENATLTAPDYRHAGVTFRPLTIDSIVNRAEALFYHKTSDSPLSSVGMRIAPQNDASILRYGERAANETFNDWYGWERIAAWADTMIDRHAQPSVQIDQLRLDLYGNDDLCAWWIETCELEKAVTVTYTPYGEAPITIDDLNIQREVLRWTPTEMTVTLTLAKS